MICFRTFYSALESDADRALFAEIYEQYHERMEQAALRILKDPHDVEDAVQNAFLKIIRPIENVSSLHSVKVATPPCTAYAAIPCGLAIRRRF